MARSDRKIGKKDRKEGNGGVSTFYWIMGAVAVLGVGAVSYAVGSSGGRAAVTSPVEVPGLNDPQQLVQLAQGVVKGDENAPLTIVEFADFQCPGCRDFSNIVLPQVGSSYVDTGEAKLVFYDFPITSIHGHAFLAARAARCAQDQGLFWEYHDALYANQNEWAYSGDASDDFVDYATGVGLDVGTFEDCLRSDRHADVVTANMRLGEELGVRGTPTVMVSRGSGMARRIDRNNFQAIAQAIQELREMEGPAGGASGG